MEMLDFFASLCVCVCVCVCVWDHLSLWVHIALSHSICLPSFPSYECTTVLSN
jgi:hypothetical protein